MRPFLLLTALEIAAFLPWAARLGFYHDDWNFLHVLGSAPGLGAQFRDLALAGSGARPVSVPVFVALYRLAGQEPLLYHLAMAAQDLLGAFLFFLLFKRLFRAEAPALAAAALGLVYPAHAATHHWFANVPQTFAQNLVVLGLVLHCDWTERRGPWRLAASLAAYLGGVLCYESAALLPLALVPFLGVRRSARELWPFAACLGAAWWWQKRGIQLVLPYSTPKSIGLSLAKVAAAYREGLLGVSAGAAALCAQGASVLAPWLTALAAALGAAAAWALGWSDAAPAKPSKKAAAPPRPSAAAPAAAAALVLAGAYLPYAIAGYTPSPSGFQSRTNALGSWAIALALGAALAARPLSRGARSALLAGLLAPFLWTDWAIASQWAETWRTQREALGTISRAAAALPPKAVMIVAWNQPRLFGADPFFLGEQWSFDAAVKLLSRRQDVLATLQTPWLVPEKDAVFDQFHQRRFPYGNLYYLDVAKGSLAALAPPR